LVHEDGFGLESFIAHKPFARTQLYKTLRTVQPTKNQNVAEAKSCFDSLL